MGKTYQKDIRRFIWKGKKRFISLMMITLLGVTMLTGLKAACDDLRRSADQLYDNQQLFDICIQSTLGLTEDDVRALAQIDGISACGGGYAETAEVEAANQTASVQLKTLISGINQPYLLEGALPAHPDEIAVSENFAADTGLSAGDTLSLTLEEGSALRLHRFTITGIVVDPGQLNQPDGAASFRSVSEADYTFFILADAVDSDIYTAVYLIVEDAAALNCYSDAYQRLISDTMERIRQECQADRQQARLQQIQEEAGQTLQEAEDDAYAQLKEAEDELQEAADQLADNQLTLTEAQAELELNRQEADEQFADARASLADGMAELETAQAQLSASADALLMQEQQLQDAQATLSSSEAETLSQLEQGRTALEEQQAAVRQAELELNAQLQILMALLPDTWPSEAWEALLDAVQSSAGAEPSLPEAAQQEFLAVLIPLVQAQLQAVQEAIAQLDPSDPEYESLLLELLEKQAMLEALPEAALTIALQLGSLQAAQAMLDAQLTMLDQQQAEAETAFAESRAQLEAGQTQIDAGWQQIAAGQQEIDSGLQKLRESEVLLQQEEENAYRQLTEAEQKLSDGWQQWEEGCRELEAGRSEYEQERRRALQELDDARAEIDQLKPPTWYIQSRDSLSSYSNIESDAGSIEAVGTAFPLVFFLVAVLISLTTITRLIEEDRPLIGTYQSLGYTPREILRKYWLYSLLACLTGGLLGDLCGFIVLPEILFIIFRYLYIIPVYRLYFNWIYGLGGVLLFTVGILAATLWSCMAQVRQKPAITMRPRAPRSGSRIFLERIRPLWRRLSFLNKVTARNLFRYKKRLLMTIFGVAGCTALVVCALAIHDSVSDLMPKQYGHIQRYDLMTVTDSDSFEDVGQALQEDPQVASSICLYIDSVKLIGQDGHAESVQLIVFPDDIDPQDYLYLEDPEGNPLTLTPDGAYITQNASQVMDFDAGDVLELQNSQLDKESITVYRIVQNYLGNMVYMTQSLYENLFGSFEPNAYMSLLSGTCEDPVAYAEQLEEKEGVLSVSSTAAFRNDFSDAFFIINMVVYIILIMAAGLALVVLFTLSATNISERTRELATIKVLGFYPSEVHRYVNKETLLLTGLGILVGLPVGHGLAGCLTYVLNMPSIYFAVSIHPVSYVLSAAISFCFALAVNRITNHTLDRINMVEAMKSVE